MDSVNGPWNWSLTHSYKIDIQGEKCLLLINSYQVGRRMLHGLVLVWDLSSVMYYVLTSSDSVFSRLIYVLASGTLSNERDVYRLYFVQINFYAIKYERGVWLRIYGIPLHAWTTEFLNLCSSQFGRLLKIDLCTIKLERLDWTQQNLIFLSLSALITKFTPANTELWKL
jgi:hypothetical protein